MNKQWTFFAVFALVLLGTGLCTVAASSAPDLTLSSSDIFFDPESPMEGDQVKITAAIHNIGDADANNVMVRFYDGDPDDAENLRQKLNRIFEDLDKQGVETGILYDKVLPFSNIDAYDGQEYVKGALANWKQMYHEMYLASFEPKALQSPSEVKAAARKRFLKEETIPTGIMSYRYNRIKPDALEKDLLKRQGGKLIDVPSRKSFPYETKHVFAASPLIDYTFRGNNVSFLIDEIFYYTNDEAPIESLEVDFGDGRGYQSARFGEVFQVNYATCGEKTIRIKAHYPGHTKQSGSSFFVRSLSIPDPDETWPFTADIPYQGQYGSGEAYVYKSDPDGPIDLPVIVTDGFDYGDERKRDELYHFLNEENLIEDGRARGLDIIVLNFDQGAGYIQRNAFLLVKLINKVNNVKSGDHELVVIGPSMGGVISRYALAYMEANNIPHHTRLFISFDSPQRGANVPLGNQYWLDFFAEFSDDAKEGRNAIDSAAAKQLLVYHYSCEPNCPSGLRNTLMSELESMGSYPNNLRKVSVSSGSGTAQGQSFGPCAQLVKYEYELEDDIIKIWQITGNTWAVPKKDDPSTKILDAKIKFWGFTIKSKQVPVQGTDPYDNAPGGMSNFTGQIADGDTGGKGDIITDHRHECFIPTISALDIATSNLFYDVAAAGDSIYDLTPFDKIYYPFENEVHNKITPTNKACFLNEASYPDLTLSSSDIFFDPESPVEGDQVNITAAIQNIGYKDAKNVTVRFYDGDPDDAGTLIGEDTIDLIPVGSWTQTTTADFDAGEQKVNINFSNDEIKLATSTEAEYRYGIPPNFTGWTETDEVDATTVGVTPQPDGSFKVHQQGTNCWANAHLHFDDSRTIVKWRLRIDTNRDVREVHVRAYDVNDNSVDLLNEAVWGAGTHWYEGTCDFVISRLRVSVKDECPYTVRTYVYLIYKYPVYPYYLNGYFVSQEHDTYRENRVWRTFSAESNFVGVAYGIPPNYIGWTGRTDEVGATTVGVTPQPDGSFKVHQQGTNRWANAHLYFDDSRTIVKWRLRIDTNRDVREVHVRAYDVNDNSVDLLNEAVWGAGTHWYEGTCDFVISRLRVSVKDERPYTVRTYVYLIYKYYQSIFYQIGSYDTPGTLWEDIPSSQKQSILVGETPTIPAKRYIKWKAELSTSYPYETPVLYHVIINYIPAQVTWYTTTAIVGQAGHHDIYVVVDPLNTITESNESNNKASKSIVVRDITPPTIEYVSLDAYTTIPVATIHVTVEATDNIGVTTVIADGTYLAETGSIWEGDITASSITGDYTLTIRAKDAAGNFAEATIDYSVVRPEGGLAVAVLPLFSNVIAGDTVDLTVKIISTENFDDKVDVYLSTEGLDNPADLGWFNWTEKNVMIPVKGNITIPLRAEIPTGESGIKMFRVIAESTMWRTEGFGTGIFGIT